MTDPLIIAGTTLSSRLIVGTAGYPNQQVMLDCLEASAAEVGHGLDPPDQPRRATPRAWSICSAAGTGCCRTRLGA